LEENIYSEVVKFGDECTKFFHAAERYWTNTITSLETDDGVSISGHEEKAVGLWEVFKNRMERSGNPQMLFNLEELVQPFQDIDSLVTPFTTSGIDEIVKNMPSNKSPGQMGLMDIF
jgi:hypothetical protein